MERQIILTALDLGIVSIILAAFFCLFGVLCSRLLSKPSIQKAEEPKTIITNQKLVLFFIVSLSIIACTILFTFLKFKHSEKSEWLTYEISSILIFLIAAFISCTKLLANKTLFNLSLFFSYLALFTQIIFLSFYSHWTSLFFLIGLVLCGYLSWKKPQTFLTSLLFSLSGIFCVLGFFILKINLYSISEIISLIFSWIALSLFVASPDPLTISPKLKSVMLAIFLIGIVFLELSPIQNTVDSHHFSFYLGPVYEISLGKSILSDFPSQYGYLSIHFISTALNVLNQGITFESFHLFHTILLGLYFSGFYLAYRYLYKNQLLVVLFASITVLTQTCFEQYSGLSMPPSTGPMRFMFGLLIVLSLWYIPKRKFKIITTCLLGAIATFWSIETAIYIVPALMFILGLDSYLQSGKTKESIHIFLKNAATYLLFTLIIFIAIIVKEFPYHHSIPSFSSYFQYAITYKNGFGSILIPLFGNYYLAIAILILGMFYTFYFVDKLSKKSLFFSELNSQNNYWVVTSLAFLAVHNVAILSYFVSRSAYTNIQNISPFLVLEIAIIFSYLKSKSSFFSHYLLSGTLFIILFSYGCLISIFPTKEVKGDLTRFKDEIEGYELLTRVYGLNPLNVVILSKDYDTLLITKYNIANRLPFNPSLMTELLPNFETKYILPNLDKVPDGTTLVYTGDMPVTFKVLEKYFVLEELKPRSRLGTTIITMGDFILYKMTRKY